ncbi:MAG: ATP-binding protein [Candidatus Competibacteraceae bacterium]
MKYSRARGSFKTQLTVTLTVSLLVLALATSLVTSGIIIQRVQALVISYAAQMTWQVGANRVFAFLVADTTVARKLIVNLRAWPGVDYVALLKRDFSPLVTEGEPVHWTLVSHPGIWQTQPFIAGEDDRYWHFAAPVYTQPVAQPYQDNPPAAEQLGYIQIAWDKSLLSTLKVLIIAVNGGISFCVAGLLIIWLRRRVNRLTEPLSSLVNVMQRARGEVGIRADIAGPQETRELGNVFNELLTKLENHQAALKSEVAIRTLELREARDAALTAARHKSEFMAATTHEMRAPLHCTLGYIQLALEELDFLDEEDIVEQLRNYLHTALGTSEELLRRINQILEFARVEAGKAEVHIQAIDTNKLVDQITETMTPLVQRRGNVLEVLHQGNNRLAIDGDKLYQIMLELLDNACKFTENGRITLRVVANEGLLTVDVADTGIGIPEDQQSFIFEPFRQLDMSLTRQQGGTGLGLAITRRFCELLGGAIRVNSQVGQGSCFSVTIPLLFQPGFNAAAALREPQGMNVSISVSRPVG